MWLSKTLQVLGRVLAIDGVLAVGVVISFLFTQDFSALNYSDRLFGLGIAVMSFGLVGVFAVVGNVGGINILKAFKPHEAKELHDRVDEIRAVREKRYDVVFQVWLVGLGCMVFSAIIYSLLVRLGIGV